MAYTPTVWKTGDTITDVKLNKLENAVGAIPKGDTGAKGDTGLGVKSLALTTDATGKVTGGTLTFTDNTTNAVAVTVAGA